MNFEVKVTEPFERKLKKLSKKYPSIKSDLLPIFEQLSKNPTQQGVPIGNECYKIRVAISSKGKGKSGGARIITYVQILKGTVFLLSIYDKSKQSTISEKELQKAIELLKQD